MPKLSSIRLDALSDLVAELRYTPRDALRRCVERTESLAMEIDAATTYPMEWVVFRVTGYRPKDAPEEMVVGEALIADLSSMLEHLSEVAEIGEADLGSETLSTEDLMERWGVSRRSIERYRRQGLVARRYQDTSGVTRLAFSADVVEAFEDRRGDRLERARSFERVGEEERDWLYRRALRYRSRLGCQFAPIAQRLSERSGRSVGAVRRALQAADEATGEPVFRVRTNLAERQSRVIARAVEWGLKPGVIAERYGRARTSVLRIAVDEHASRLREWRDRIVPADAPDGFDLDRVGDEILRTPGATEFVLESPVLEAKALLASVEAMPQLTASREAEMGAARYLLLTRAGRAIDDLAPSMALGTAVDAIETDLRWALGLQRMLVRTQLPLVVRTIEQRLGFGLLTLRPDQIRRIVRLAMDAACRATGTFHPVRPAKSLTTFGRLASPVSLALNRSLSAIDSDGLEAAEGIGRASTGRAELDDWTRRLTPWQPLVEVHPGLLGLVRDKAAPLRDKDRALVGARFGLGGSPPMTNAAVAEEFGATPARVVSAYRRARRALRERA